jgi:hypothetical protein
MSLPIFYVLEIPGLLTPNRSLGRVQ